MSTWCSKHVEAWNKLIVKQILCIKLVTYLDKYTEMHGQQNIKKKSFCRVCRVKVGKYMLGVQQFGDLEVTLWFQSYAAHISDHT